MASYWNINTFVFTIQMLLNKKTFFVAIGTNYETKVCLSIRDTTCMLCLFLSGLFTSVSVDVGSRVNTEGAQIKPF